MDPSRPPDPSTAGPSSHAKEPLWREEFSIFTADERYVSRRQMTKFLTLTSLSMFAGNLWLLARSMFAKHGAAIPEAAIAKVGEIPVSGVKLFQYAGEQCILVRIGESSYVAYSQKCTHLSCAVYYEKDKNRLECPCHEGYFSIQDGSVLQGPPTRPLPKVTLEQRGADLIAVGMSGGES
jgi:nitrite reductase/ring-hydroxylating ferredoxin subunit